jgi:hypothetical protein
MALVLLVFALVLTLPILLVHIPVGEIAKSVMIVKMEIMVPPLGPQLTMLVLVLPILLVHSPVL